jgi:trimeric autotransporter adhesin
MVIYLGDSGYSYVNPPNDRGTIQHVGSYDFSGADNLSGGDGSDTIYGEGGNDIIYGQTSTSPDAAYDPVVYDDDYLYGEDGNDTIYGGVGNDEIEGGNGDDLLNGGGGNDIIRGGAGNDTMYAGGVYGYDELDGGTGDDILYARANGGSVLAGGNGNDILNGGIGSDAFCYGGKVGPYGNDVINDLGGESDTLAFYYAFFTTYWEIYNTGGTLSINLNTDTSYTLASGYSINWQSVGVIENLIGSTGNDTFIGDGDSNTLEGREGNDVLTGNGGNDLFRGGAGNDTLDGGDGDDIYDVYAYSTTFGVDTITDSSGNDRLDFTQGSYSTPFAIAIDLSTQTSFQQNTGNVLSWTLGSIENISGAALDDTLTGDTDSNILIGNNGNDTLSGGIGLDNLQGGNGNDILNGGAGADKLFGGAGLNTMSGGTGSDTYEVRLATDVIIENFNEGNTDTVNSYATFTLSDNIELLTLLVGNTTGTGNSLDNFLTASGNGVQTLKGLTGDDTYIISETIDVVQENANEGIDIVKASTNYTLSNEVENIDLSGSDTTGVGNAMANQLRAIGTGNQVLNGAGGNDTLIATGSGNTTFLFDNGFGQDVVTATTTDDETLSFANYTQQAVTISLNNSSFTDGFGNNVAWTSGQINNLTGSALADTLTGDGQSNKLQGNAGNDTLNGGLGDDIYVFTAGFGVDTIVDTSGTDDRIDLSTLGSGFSGIDLNSTSYINGANTISWSLGSIEGVLAGAGNQILIGDGDSNIFSSGDGQDTLTGNNGNDQLSGEGGNDTLTGDGGADFLDGGSGNDSLNGGAGVDTLIGGSGDDLLVGSTGSDFYTGYSGAFGVDTISDDSGVGEQLNLSAYTTANVTSWAAVDTNTDGFVDQLVMTMAAYGTIRMNNYFNNTSGDDDLSGQGIGLIETMVFGNDPSVTFTDVQLLIA